MGGYHELFSEPPCILLDIQVLHCPGYTPLGMYYQSIEENAGDQKKSCFKRLFRIHHPDYSESSRAE